VDVGVGGPGVDGAVEQFAGGADHRGAADVDLQPIDSDYLQRRPVSKRVNSSRADDGDASLGRRCFRACTHKSRLFGNHRVMSALPQSGN
jgi:hypothetical protein